MDHILLEAPAKINWSLDVIGKRPDGYHLLASVMQTVSLADSVEVALLSAAEGISVVCDRPGIPCDSRNTCFRAASRFLAMGGESSRVGVRIRIGKRIPEAAGLAGGSADAAATLFGLARLLPGAVSLQGLLDIAAATGADVPFCLIGGTALCEGIGEIVSPLPAAEGIPLLLLKPDFGVSTPTAFRALSLDAMQDRPDTPGMCRALSLRDLPAIAEASGNVLQPVALSAYPALAEGIEALSSTGPFLCRMTGSGPTLFAAYADENTRDRAAEGPAVAVLRDAGWFVSSCTTVAHGPREVLR